MGAEEVGLLDLMVMVLLAEQGMGDQQALVVVVVVTEEEQQGKLVQ
jgi:hypothetical protein